MNRTHLRALPALPVPGTPPEELLRAESELAVAFEGLLACGARDEEAPEYEWLEAAVDGTLDPIEAELFASRLAGDPLLQREFDELVALRDRLRISPAASRVAAGRSGGRRWLSLAAAAVVLVAASLAFRQDLDRTPSPVAGLASNAAATSVPADAANAANAASVSAGEPLFADSFEGGTTGSWSN